MGYGLHVATLVGIYGTLAAALNLVFGYSGMMSIGHAALFGIGAYVAAILSLEAGLGFITGLAAAVCAGAISGVVLSLPSTRARRDYFVLATFAFQIVVTALMRNWTELTGGPMGLPGIPRPVIAGVAISTPLAFMLLATALCLCSVAVSMRISRSPMGRALRAVRDDEVFARSLGKDVTRLKLTVFGVSGGLAGAAGALYAHYVTFIDPTTFTVMESILVLAAVIVGGAGTVAGPWVGIVILIALPEALRFVGLPAAAAANIRQMLFGSLLIIFMIRRPEGIMGDYHFAKAENSIHHGTA